MTAVKTFARAVTPPFVWGVLSRVKRALTGGGAEQASRYFGLQELDKKLEEYVDFDGGFFVEVGGWDGITHSNSLYFERYRGWRGVLIEPSPSEFLKCRRDRPAAKVFCYACVPFEYPDRFVPMLYCASMTVTNRDDVSVDARAHVEDGRKFLPPGGEVFEFGAVAKPLSRILDENEISDSIDLLVLDVEGYELSVLKGIDFSRHGPRFICVEAWNLREIECFLKERGYECLGRLTKHDWLYRRR